MNVKRLSKRTLATFLSVLLLLSSLVAGSVTTANATWGTDATIENPIKHIYVYFDNSTKKYYSTAKSSRIYMFVATNDTVYNSAAFTPVSDYQSLVYKDVNYNGNGDFKDVNWSEVTSVFFGTASDSSKPKAEEALSKYNNSLEEYKTNNGIFSNFTGSYTEGFTVSNCNALYFSGSSSLTATNFGGTNTSAYENMLFSQNVYGVGTVTVDSYYNLTGVGTADFVSSNNSASVTALYNSPVTIKATATESSGDFLGWYDNAAFSGNAVSDQATYTYTATGETSYYAKFSNGSTQVAVAGEGGTASVSAGEVSDESIFVTSGTSVKFTAIPDNNYQFDGWYANASFTGTAVSTDDPYTLTVDSANTLYAKFSAIETSNNEGDDGTVPTETRPSNRNKAARNINATVLSNQAKTYYQEEVKNVAGYRTADSNTSNVYGSFKYLANKEETNDNQDSFYAIYRQKTNEDPSDIKVFEAEDDSASATKYVSSNSLYTALYDIMSSTHTHGVSYAAYGRNSLAHYWLTTDSSSINAGDGDGRGVYTFFYSNVSDFNHENMQREHIWPKSKASYLMKTGLGGSDLHHLRPAYGKLNLLKLNWGFASIKDETDNSKAKSGWSKLRTLNWPDTETNKVTALWRAENNGETFIDVKDDVRGDVARILLYIYTRWNQPNLYSDIVDAEGNPDTSRLPKMDPDDSKDTGERVFYNRQTLLDWMEQDPVSEWEMKRNDLTQDIQGNRNVFIDYPELAWLLFDQTVPSDMPTPSGMAQNDSSKDIQKADNDVITNPVTLDFNNINGNGEAEVTAYDLTTKRNVKNGDQVARGDVITFTVIPDQSEITDIREFSGDTDTDSNANRYKIAEPNSSNEYTFTRQAGYFKSDVYDNTGYSKERIRITLNSNVTVLSYKVNSLTTSGNSGGSGDGMVTARIAGTQTMLENGDSVPNGTDVTLTFTPDYGSRFARVSSSNQIEITPTQISGTDTYQATVTLDCSSGSARTKKFTIYFAQTFNATAGSEDLKKHINNKGMRPDEGDNWKDETDFTENFEICGVQMKKITEEEDNKALRFVSVIDKNILDKAKSYGYVIGYTKRNNLSREAINRFAFSLVKGGGAGLTVDCTGSSNDSFGAYGKAETNTNYKYVTAAVHHLEQLDENGQNDLDTVIIARPYVELKSDYVATGGPSVIYGQYVDFNTGENFCACSGSYNDVLKLANEQ